MRYLNYNYLLFGIVLVFASCAGKQYQALFEKRSQIAGAAPAAPVRVDDYRIMPQDVIQIRNLQSIKYIVDLPNGNGGTTNGGGGGQGEAFQVEEDGRVALPVIGHVKLEGLTRMEATQKIEGLYRDSLLRNPIIELKILNLKVTILGEIRSQGNYPLLKDKVSLVEMIGEAGGLNERADETNVKIIRGSKDNPEVTRIDLSDIASLNNPAAILQNGDIIYVAQNNRTIRSDKLQTFSSLIQPALIIFNTALIIFTLAHR